MSAEQVTSSTATTSASAASEVAPVTVESVKVSASAVATESKASPTAASAPKEQIDEKKDKVPDAKAAPKEQTEAQDKPKLVHIPFPGGRITVGSRVCKSQQDWDKIVEDLLDEVKEGGGKKKEKESKEKEKPVHVAQSLKDLLGLDKELDELLSILGSLPSKDKTKAAADERKRKPAETEHVHDWSNFFSKVFPRKQAPATPAPTTAKAAAAESPKAPTTESKAPVSETTDEKKAKPSHKRRRTDSMDTTEDDPMEDVPELVPSSDEEDVKTVPLNIHLHLSGDGETSSDSSEDEDEDEEDRTDSAPIKAFRLQKDLEMQKLRLKTTFAHIKSVIDAASYLRSNFPGSRIRAQAEQAALECFKLISNETVLISQMQHKALSLWS